jgi:hypothetical protein
MATARFFRFLKKETITHTYDDDSARDVVEEFETRYRLDLSEGEASTLLEFANTVPVTNNEKNRNLRNIRDALGKVLHAGQDVATRR